MILPRKLVYEEKTSKDFEIDIKGSINQKIYDGWILKKIELDPEAPAFYSDISKVFNDAYFVCTVVLMNKTTEIKLAYFKDKISIPSLVYPLVYYYLSNLKSGMLDGKRILILIDNLFRRHEDWKINYDELIEVKGVKDKHSIPLSTFAPRKLDPELLSETSWWNVTSYKVKEIKRTIGLVAKNSEECKMMAQAIYYAICYTEEENEREVYWDDDGNEYINNVKYPEAKQLCKQILENTEESYKLLRKQWIITHEASQQEDINTFPFKRELKDMLKEDWFDNCCNEINKYTDEWREKLVDDFVQSDYGYEIAKVWTTNPSKRNLIKCSLVGALSDARVLKGNKNKLAKELSLEGMNDDTKADYMGSKGEKPYLDWLKSYVSQE